jgi:CheY-like chemotaxis protein
MIVLRKAVARGYRTAHAYRKESALDPLRTRPDFQLLILDLSFPASPFARSDSSAFYPTSRIKNGQKRTQARIRAG